MFRFEHQCNQVLPPIYLADYLDPYHYFDKRRVFKIIQAVPSRFLNVLEAHDKPLRRYCRLELNKLQLV